MKVHDLLKATQYFVSQTGDPSKLLKLKKGSSLPKHPFLVSMGNLMKQII